MKKFSALGVAAGSALVLGGCAASGPMSKADKAFAQGEYEPAIALYKADVAKGKNAGEANYRIAESYRRSNRIDQAEPFYKAAMDAGAKDADLAYYYGESLKANGKLSEATTQFSAAAESGSGMAQAARMQAQNAQASQALMSMPARYDVMPLDAVNSPSSDFSASRMPGSGELVFASGRGNKTYEGNGETFLSLYAQKFDDATAMTGGTARKLESNFNNDSELQASATYTPDGQTMVFARSNDGSKKGKKSVDLYAAFYRNGTWSTPEALAINDLSADDFAPAFAPDGTTLYFASGRAGGQGGNDLYKTTLQTNGTFSAPENLGEAVNTVGNDNFPGIAPDGTLYFSSDGQPGYGRLDIFKYEGGKVTNLGPNVNSSSDDFAPFFTGPNANIGVFSSNRTGGKGSDDLYTFKKKEPRRVNFFADGTLLEYDAKTGTTKPAANGTVTITSANGQKMNLTSDAEGKFTTKLDSAQSYALFAERAGDIAARASVSTVGRTPDVASLTQEQTEVRIPVSLTVNKIIINKAIALRDILYDYDKSNIRPDAAIRLDTLVQTLTDNPSINIELGSHTDSRGNDAYNQKLSQKRAEAAVNYIVSKGIDRSRITAKGYGESQPLIKNAKTEAQFQRNRRTEFKVTRVTQ